MHLRLLTNLLFRHFDLPLRPPLHRLRPKCRISSIVRSSAASASLRFPCQFLYGADYRREWISKIRVLLKKCLKTPRR